MHIRVCIVLEHTLDSSRVAALVPQQLGPYRAWTNNRDLRSVTLNEGAA